jgi:hypothetical protein
MPAFNCGWCPNGFSGRLMGNCSTLCVTSRPSLRDWTSTAPTRQRDAARMAELKPQDLRYWRWSLALGRR